MKNKKTKPNNKKNFNKNKNFKRKPVDFRADIDIKSRFKKVEIGIKNGVFVFVNNLTIQEFASKLNISAAEIIKHLFLKKGLNCNLNTVLDENQIGELCLEFGYDFKKETQTTEDNFLDHLSDHLEEEKSTTLTKRPPIITVMGHVDHGKTTLLDQIRKTKIADLEVGKITQRIGAYQVEWKNELITFFDTPGHEAFSEMRAMGADLTDIVVIVIAADDGLKPQTEEAIDHALYAKTPIIVFINKIDRPNNNIEKIYAALAEKKVLVEPWGGNVPVIQGSALNNIGVDELLETIVLTAELLELKANPNRIANGITIEASLDKREGIVADLLIQNGTLLINDYILVGNHYGKVKKIINDKQMDLKTASPSCPVRVTGLNGIPKSGDKWIVIKDFDTLKELAEKRTATAKEKQRNQNWDFQQLQTPNKENVKDLNIILKTDNNGSLQAILNLLKTVQVENTTMHLVRASVGAVSETDVNLAKIANAYIITFNLKANNQILDYAKRMLVPIKNFTIIYEIKNAVEKILKNKLDPVIVEKMIGKVEIRQLWKHSSIGTIAGCRVVYGDIKRNAFAKVLRNSEVILEKDKIISLRQQKDNVTSVSIGKECGFTLENFNDFAVNDVVEVFEMVEVKDE